MGTCNSTASVRFEMLFPQICFRGTRCLNWERCWLHENPSVSCFRGSATKRCGHLTHSRSLFWIPWTCLSVGWVVHPAEACEWVSRQGRIWSNQQLADSAHISYLQAVPAATGFNNPAHLTADSLANGLSQVRFTFPHTFGQQENIPYFASLDRCTGVSRNRSLCSSCVLIELARTSCIINLHLPKRYTCPTLGIGTHDCGAFTVANQHLVHSLLDQEM